MRKKVFRISMIVCVLFIMLIISVKLYFRHTINTILSGSEMFINKYSFTDNSLVLSVRSGNDFGHNVAAGVQKLLDYTSENALLSNYFEYTVKLGTEYTPLAEIQVKKIGSKHYITELSCDYPCITPEFLSELELFYIEKLDYNSVLPIYQDSKCFNGCYELKELTVDIRNGYEELKNVDFEYILTELYNLEQLRIICYDYESKVYTFGIVDELKDINSNCRIAVLSMD